jgi:hypothetical protein
VPERVRDLPSDPPRPRTNIWPYVLILVGALLLALNLGWLPSSLLWSLLSAWPLLLVAVGVDMVTAGQRRPLVLGALALALVVWLVASPSATARVSERVTLAYPTADAQMATLQLRSGVGSVSVRAGAADGNLITGTIDLLPGETLMRSLDRDGVRADVALAVQSVGSRSTWGTWASPTWSLLIAPDLPWMLTATAGVGRVELDLSRVTLAALRYAGGVGETTITLPPHGGYSVNADLGVGATTLRIPASVEARLVVRTGIGGVNVQGDFDRNDNVYTTPGYARAAPESRIDVRLNAGVGGVSVRRLRD